MHFINSPSAGHGVFTVVIDTIGIAHVSKWGTCMKVDADIRIELMHSRVATGGLSSWLIRGGGSAGNRTLICPLKGRGYLFRCTTGPWCTG